MADASPQPCILVIDDEPGIAELIGDFCEGLGYAVKVVTDSRQAFQAAKDLKPKLITLDLQMPELDGFELLKRFKADPDTADVPVIIVSVLAREVERQGLLSAAQAVLAKPIHFKTLKERVDHYTKPS
jgi:CheY-like chemotaxis protein